MSDGTLATDGSVTTELLRFQDNLSHLEGVLESISDTIKKLPQDADFYYKFRAPATTSAEPGESMGGDFGKEWWAYVESFAQLQTLLGLLLVVALIHAGICLVLSKGGKGSSWIWGAGRHGVPNNREKPYWALKGEPCTVAFLAHPPTLLSTFAHWLPEKNPRSRWRGSWWMVPAWPVTFVLSWINFYLSPLVHGPYFMADTFTYLGLSNQVWLSRAFGYQFMLSFLQRDIARGIVKALQVADSSGVEVLGLGALNKAEFINGGGDQVLQGYQPRTTRLVHGNTLTAAVVVENVKEIVARERREGSLAGAGGYLDEFQSLGGVERSVFLTGATSKVGRAVALRLALEGFHVVCCTSSAQRFDVLAREFLEMLEASTKVKEK
ncbi:unnamed protein product, partial [Discosporangium mesarthrocarpum]